MHDIRLIRDDPAAFDAALMRRDPAFAGTAQHILELDEQRRAHLQKLQAAQARRNAASKAIGRAKAAKDEAEAERLIAEVAQLKTAIQEGEEEERRLDRLLQEALCELPNLPLDDVPVGRDESANVEVRRWGEPRAFDFSPKQHFEIGEALGLMDFDTAARIAGARFVVLKGALARLERAIAAFMLDLHTCEFGYTEVLPPALVRDEAMFGTGQLPKFKADLFSVGNAQWFEEAFNQAIDEFDRDELPHKDIGFRMGEVMKRLWLIPTAEVPLTNLVREAILPEDALPQRVTAWTPCFRAEAGAAGKDTRGMIRQHQFSKVELVSITTPEQSLDELERMTACAEEVLKRLELPYRVVVLSTGDMGFSAAKTYDIEIWLPGQGTFREISSCSLCGDFQARRMQARYRPNDGKELRYVHTLNGSGLAVGRTMIAILENYQQPDGSVIIPQALRPYMGGRDRIAAA